MVWNNNRYECWHCGDARHETGDCPTLTTQKLAVSLSGAKLGRSAGFRTAQSKAAELVLKHVKDLETGIALYNAILDLKDET